MTPAAASAADELLARFCDDLRTLRTEAGGPSLRDLADQVGLGKSQLGAILNGDIRTLPDWGVVRALLECCYKHAHDRGRVASLSRRAGIDEYWRPRFAAVEQLVSEPAATSRRDAAPVWTAPRQLPHRIPHFVGRHADLAALDTVTDPVVVSGAAGVGKTALAVSWAHRVADRFPDGQLYVNLRGFDPSGEPLTSAEAVRGFLDAFAVLPHRIPARPEAQIGLYRSLLAGRRVLVILDNARDAEQVRPLLPAAPGCRAVVTSRSQLAGLVVSEGARVLRLDLLSPAEAEELLASRIGGERLVAERGAAAQIAEACARMPLALCVVASRAALQPRLSLAALVTEVRAEAATDGLGAFRTGDGGTEPRAVFSWSYRLLSDRAARLLRLLGLPPCDGIGAPAAASLAGVPVGPTRSDLTELIDAGLLTEAAPGRYALHDLVRAYARELVFTIDAEAERREAMHRVLDHYLHTAHRAAALLHPHLSPIDPAPPRPGAAPRDLADRAAAQDWFDTERSVLLAVVGHAADGGYGSYAWQLAWTLSGYLDRQALWPEWLAAQEIALRAADRDGDRLGQAHARRDLARACSRLGRDDVAYAHLERARDLFAELGDAAGLAHVHLNLGQALERAARYLAALDHSRQALALYTTAGSAAGQAYTLNAVGRQLALLGEYGPAVASCKQALERMQAIGDRQGEADTWNSLGYAHHHLGEYDTAIACHRQALEMFVADGNRYGEATSLDNLAESHHARADESAALAAWRRAERILREIGHPGADRLRDQLARVT